MDGSPRKYPHPWIATRPRKLRILYENWCIHDDAESLFTYEPGKWRSDYDLCDRGFQGEVDINTAPQELIDLCQGNRDCLEDGIIGGLEIASETRQTGDAISEIRIGEDPNIAHDRPCGVEAYDVDGNGDTPSDDVRTMQIESYGDGTLTFRIYQYWKSGSDSNVSWISAVYKKPDNSYACDKDDSEGDNLYGSYDEYTVKCEADGFAYVDVYTHDGQWKSAFTTNPGNSNDGRPGSCSGWPHGTNWIAAPVIAILSQNNLLLSVKAIPEIVARYRKKKIHALPTGHSVTKSPQMSSRTHMEDVVKAPTAKETASGLLLVDQFLLGTLCPQIPLEIPPNTFHMTVREVIMMSAPLLRILDLR